MLNKNQIENIFSQFQTIKQLQDFEKEVLKQRKILTREHKSKFICDIKKVYDTSEFKKLFNFYEFIVSCLPLIKARYAKKNLNFKKIKYQNPLNPEQVWSGIGFKPNWLKNGLKENKFTLEQCKISEKPEHSIDIEEFPKN